MKAKFNNDQVWYIADNRITIEIGTGHQTTDFVSSTNDGSFVTIPNLGKQYIPPRKGCPYKVNDFIKWLNWHLKESQYVNFEFIPH